jgi:hypothetical protein
MILPQKSNINSQFWEARFNDEYYLLKNAYFLKIMITKPFADSDFSTLKTSDSAL